MTDAFGTRAVFAVLLPATNTVVEPDLAALRPAGVTNQSFRFAFPGQPDSVVELVELMRPAVELARACRPDRLVVAYTPEYMADSVDASRRLGAAVEAIGGAPTTVAADGVIRALKVLGIRRVGLVTPYRDAANRNLEAHLARHGITVAGAVGLGAALKRSTTTTQVREAAVREAFARADRADAEALLQVGTALVCTGFVADLEARHGKPVVAVNTATYWWALRQHAIADRLAGFGTLLRDH